MYFCLTGIRCNKPAKVFRKVPLEDFRTAKLMIFELEELMSPQDAEEAAFKLGLARKNLTIVEQQCQGNPREHVNRILEELIATKKNEISPMDILHVLLSMGRKELTDIALRCHERFYFGRNTSLGDNRKTGHNRKKKKRKNFEVMI